VAQVAEGLAGMGGRVLGQAGVIAVGSASAALFESCAGDACDISPLFYVTLVASELLLPRVTSALARAAVQER
jgi:hypothetical protein